MKRDSRKKLLIIEDDDLFRKGMNDFLSRMYQTIAVESAEAALEKVPRMDPDLILMDITLPGISGIDLLRSLKKNRPQIPVIMLTAIEQVQTVVECIKLGAFDYLTKPFIPDDLLSSIERALESTEMKQEVEQRRNLQLLTNKEYELVGSSSAMERIRKEIQTVARSDSCVLIEGETGTGKEVVARQIHAQSSRASRPFVAINCGAIPENLVESEFFGYRKGAYTGAAASEIGKFQLANHGTLLLDEISDLPAEAQAKLLRVLEEQEFYPVGGTELIKVDVRVIAATNRRLLDLVNEKRFREDLFFRLNVYSISIPPLRERKEDILELATYFMKRFNIRFNKNFTSIAGEAREILLNHSWKGNIRELRNTMERIVLSAEGPVIKKEHLAIVNHPSVTAGNGSIFRLPADGVDLEELEKELMRQALEQSHGNKTKAARLLRMSPATFYYRLEKYGL